MVKLHVLDVVNDPRSHTFVEAVAKGAPKKLGFIDSMVELLTHRAANANGKDILPNPLDRMF